MAGKPLVGSLSESERRFRSNNADKVRITGYAALRRRLQAFGTGAAEIVIRDRDE